MAASPKTTGERLGPRALALKDEVHRLVVDVVDLSRVDRMSPERLRSEVAELARRLAPQVDRQISTADIERVSDEVIAEVFGLGPLEPLLADKAVTEILVNAPDQVYYERDGRLHRADAAFVDRAHLTRVIQRIASRIGRRIDESSPMVDARLPDGSRVNAVLPPITLDGPVLAIRRFGLNLGVNELIASASATPEMFVLLRAAVSARINILISGGTGAGKTTLLNILSAFIPDGERLVTIEDAAELRLRQPHVVRMETRSANLEGYGQVTQRDLLRNALRMRPDRIIVGEVRGPEVIDMLQAMNTGHEGSLTTVHANDTRDALSRLELMIGLSGVELPLGVMRNYVGAAIQLIVHLSRLAGGARRVTRVSELLGVNRKTKAYRVRDIFRFDQEGVVRGVATGVFRATGYVPALVARLDTAGFPVPESLFAARDLLQVLPPAEELDETDTDGAPDLDLEGGGR